MAILQSDNTRAPDPFESYYLNKMDKEATAKQSTRSEPTLNEVSDKDFKGNNYEYWQGTREGLTNLVDNALQADASGVLEELGYDTAAKTAMGVNLLFGDPRVLSRFVMNRVLKDPAAMRKLLRLFKINPRVNEGSPLWAGLEGKMLKAEDVSYPELYHGGPIGENDKLTNINHMPVKGKDSRESIVNAEYGNQETFGEFPETNTLEKSMSPKEYDAKSASGVIMPKRVLYQQSADPKISTGRTGIGFHLSANPRENATNKSIIEDPNWQPTFAGSDKNTTGFVSEVKNPLIMGSQLTAEFDKVAKEIMNDKTLTDLQKRDMIRAMAADLTNYADVRSYDAIIGLKPPSRLERTAPNMNVIDPKSLTEL